MSGNFRWTTPTRPSSKQARIGVSLCEHHRQRWARTNSRKRSGAHISNIRGRGREACAFLRAGSKEGLDQQQLGEWFTKQMQHIGGLGPLWTCSGRLQRARRRQGDRWFVVFARKSKKKKQLPNVGKEGGADHQLDRAAACPRRCVHAFTVRAPWMRVLSLGRVLKLRLLQGKASPSPPVGPALGQRGVKTIDFCKQFNDRTKQYIQGVPIRVIMTVRPDRSFTFVTKTPPTAWLLLQAMGLEKGSSRPSHTSIGELSIKHIYEIALIKKTDPGCEDISDEAMCSRVLAQAKGMGITVVRGEDVAV
ncbi:hypothetical protein HDU82_001714 [Entophlyctis luteolus]|nr:hypothetical protein HDU82_001714 [Entophlyctis luteolus]